MATLRRPMRQWSAKPPLGVPAAPRAPFTDSLAQLWLFNESGGATINDPVRNTVGTLGSTAKWAATALGSGVAGDGTATGSIPLSGAPAITTLPFSIGCWIYLPSASTFGAFIKVGDGLSGVAIGVGNTDMSTAGNHLIGLHEQWAWINTAVNIGTGLHFVVMTEDATRKPLLYLDGKLVYSAPTALTITAPANVATLLGYTSTQGGTFQRYPVATMAQAFIYARVLTAPEIAHLFVYPFSYYAPASPLLISFSLTSTFAVTAAVTQTSTAALTRSDVALRAVAQTSAASSQRLDALTRGAAQASVAAVQRAAARLAAMQQAAVPALTRTDAARRAATQASAPAAPKATSAARSAVQASVARAPKTLSAARSAVQASAAALRKVTTAARGVAAASVAAVLFPAGAFTGAARAVYALVARAVSFVLPARGTAFQLRPRAYAFTLPKGTGGSSFMMAIPTDPTRVALIGKHEVNQAYQLDLTNGLNGEGLALSTPIAPLLLQIKNGQTTQDVSSAKLRSWSVSIAAPYILTFVIGDGAQLPGYTYLAGAYVTTGTGRIFEAYIAVPCPIEPGL